MYTVALHDRIVGGVLAEEDEFPWLVNYNLAHVNRHSFFQNFIEIGHPSCRQHLVISGKTIKCHINAVPQ